MIENHPIRLFLLLQLLVVLVCLSAADVFHDQEETHESNFRLRRGRGRRKGRRHLANSVPYDIDMTQANLVNAKTNAYGMPIISVCVIDSGLDSTHKGVQKRHIKGASFGNVGDWNKSRSSHGMSTVSALAALDQNDWGVRGVESRGNLRLLIARVFSDQDKIFADITEAMEWCANEGANVINLSLGDIEITPPEEKMVSNLYNRKNILLVAAAGNGGSGFQRMHYPASFSEVISVGMLGENMMVSRDSQKNEQVELVAPGEKILSMTPRGIGRLGSVRVDSSGFGLTGMPLEFSVTTDRDGISGVLVDCGYGDRQCPSSKSGRQHLCLIKRSHPDPWIALTFPEKVKACENSGGIGAIIYNHIDDDGPVHGSLMDQRLGTSTTIPAIGISTAEGLQLLSTYEGKDVILTIRNDEKYEYSTGTSMAAPHVAGIAAIVWSHHPQCSNKQIRKVLQITAGDKGLMGRDNSYGFGIVRAKDALDYLDQNGCPDI